MMEVEWHSESVEVDSLQQLETLLDQLHDEFQRSRPSIVTVRLQPSGDSLSIGLGRDFSILSYVHGSGDPPYLLSHGTNDGEGVVTFDFNGEPSEYPAWGAVSNHDARQAVRDFCSTGKLSAKIAWEPG